MLAITSTLNNLTSKMTKFSGNPENRNWLTAASVAAISSLAYMAWINRRVTIDPSKCVVVITGCDSGFGLATAETLSAQGYAVIATCMTDAGISHLKSIVAEVLFCDVTNEANVLELSSVVTSYLSKHEGSKLWTLINNAGIAPGGLTDWLEMSTFRLLMEVNYFAPVRLTKEFLPLLKCTCGSRIINLSSIAGIASGLMIGPYAASKHALEGVGKALREELAPWNIHVCHINPGFMNTNIIRNGEDWCRRLFNEAPKSITDQYNTPPFDDLQNVVSSVLENKSIVVDAIVKLITLANPPFWTFPGYQATVASWLMHLPRGLLESLQRMISPKIEPKKAVLNKIQRDC